MGNNTYKSIGKPLTSRYNWVITKNKELYNFDINDSIEKNKVYYLSYELMLEVINKYSYNMFWVIGGSSIYQLFLDNFYLNEYHITKLENSYECDTFFNSIKQIYDSEYYYICSTKNYLEEEHSYYIYKYNSNIEFNKSFRLFRDQIILSKFNKLIINRLDKTSIKIYWELPKLTANIPNIYSNPIINEIDLFEYSNYYSTSIIDCDCCSQVIYIC